MAIEENKNYLILKEFKSIIPLIIDSDKSEKTEKNYENGLRSLEKMLKKMSNIGLIPHNMKANADKMSDGFRGELNSAIAYFLYLSEFISPNENMAYSDEIKEQYINSIVYLAYASKVYLEDTLLKLKGAKEKEKIKGFFF